MQSATHAALNVASLGYKAVAKSSAVAAAKSGAATALSARGEGGGHAPNPAQTAGPVAATGNKKDTTPCGGSDEKSTDG